MAMTVRWAAISRTSRPGADADPRERFRRDDNQVDQPTYALVKTGSAFGAGAAKNTGLDGLRALRSRQLASLCVVAFVAAACGPSAPSTLRATSSSTGTTTLKWTHPVASSAPSPHDSAAITGDPGGVLIFGGEKRQFSGGPYLDDTWRYANGAWRQIRLALRPPALLGGGMAYDPHDNVTVLFGGGNAAGSCTAATWKFSNDKWYKDQTSVHPSARYVGGMAYSPANEGILMFGGSVATPVAPEPANDTWLWTKAGWHQLHPAHAPPAVAVDAMASDPATDQVVLLTGMYATGSKTDAGETWIWNGRTWIRSASAPSPAVRVGSAVAYDPALREVVLFGGSDGASPPAGILNDAWGWTGTEWKVLLQVSPPPGQVFPAMAYDTTGARLLLLQANAPTSSSTWLAAF